MSRSAAILVRFGVLLAVLMAMVLVAHTVHLDYDSRLQIEQANVLHTPVFAAICAVIWWLIPGKLVPGWRRLVAAFAITCVIGILGELVQRSGSRNADPYDVLRDLAGAGIACLLIVAWKAARARRVAVVAAALVLATIAFYPLISWIGVLREREAQLPMLASFDSDWELKLWKTHVAQFELTRPPAEWGAATGRVARLELRPGEFPGLHSEEIYPNWSGYEALVIDFYNPGEPLELSLRVHDRSHDQRFEDRFNAVVPLPGGPTEFRIPLARIRGAPEGRENDMTHIQGLSMFAYWLRRPATVYVDGIRLE